MILSNSSDLSVGISAYFKFCYRARMSRCGGLTRKPDCWKREMGGAGGSALSPHLFCPVFPKGRLIPSKPPCFCGNLFPSPLSLPNSRLLLSFRKGNSYPEALSKTSEEWAETGNQTERIEGYCKISFTNYRVSPEI